MNFENESFPLPSQSEIDDIIVEAKSLIIGGDNLQVPKALPPTNGRQVQHAAKRRKGW